MTDDVEGIDLRTMLFVEGPLLERDTFPVEGDCSVEEVPGFPEVEVDFPPLEVPLEELEGDFPLDLPPVAVELPVSFAFPAISFPRD